MNQLAPIEELRSWIEEARSTGQPHPASVAFITVSEGGAPSARTVTLKRIEEGELIFTSALWTRKAAEIDSNPQVALLFHWQALGRQVHISGIARPGDRELAEELFAERDLAHQRQALISRQGEPIDDLQPLRDDLARLVASGDEPTCPEDWGALRVSPIVFEFWAESPDRLHERRLFRRDGEGWNLELLAP
jgi:pyridoxamine 5'-phosphate oxidase